MCGIVGVASNSPMTVQMKEFFQSLLYHDIVRGNHATGVAAIDTLDRSLCVEKRALPADLFLMVQPAMDNLFNHKYNYNIYIGHNRFATQGKKDEDANAHPFVHGDIVGVHNGTLRDQKLLDDHKDFIVDSDNLYHHLNKNGLDDTLAKLDGAFSLVWYDKSNNTLNFIRNDERPMAIALLTNGCWVWASEMGMLRWLISRHKSLSIATVKEDKVDVQQIWQLEKGLHFMVPFKDKSRQMDKTRACKKELPTFTKSYGSYSGGYGWDNNYGQSRSSNRVVHNGQRHSNSYKSPYVVKQDSAVAKWLPGGDTSSFLELIFLGHAHPESKSGFKQNLSLFKYRNTAGQEITLFSYNHGGNICANWDESRIGEKVFAQIGSAIEINNATYDVTKNEGHDWVFTVIGISLTRPAAFFSYTDGDPTMKVDSNGNWTVIKKEGGSSKVLPFREKAGKKDKKKSDVRSLSSAMSDAEKIADPSIDTDKVMLVIGGQELVSKWRMRQYIQENNGCCSNCGVSLLRQQVSSIHLIEWYDREKGEVQNWLTCGAICHTQMEDFMEQCDEELDMRLGILSGNKHE